MQNKKNIGNSYRSIAFHWFSIWNAFFFLYIIYYNDKLHEGFFIKKIIKMRLPR